MKLVLERPEHGSDQCDVYNPAAIKYPYADGVYLMFPSLYRHDTDTLDIGLAVSRDGLRWTRPDPATPFIALGPAGSFDCGSLYMGQGIIRTNNGLSLYYSGSPLKHNEAELPNLTKPGNQRIFSRAVTPLDRFVAVTADAVGGSFATPPLLFQGGLLALNVEIGEGGSVRVGLAGENGESTTDRTLDDCLPIGGDHLAAAVRWKTGCSVSSRAAIPTRLNFSLKNARLYAFRFTASGDETD
jgi:hypothetical protein